MHKNESVLAGVIRAKDITVSQSYTPDCHVIASLGALPTTDEGWAKLRADEENRRALIRKQVEEFDTSRTAPTNGKKGFFVFRAGGTSPSVIHQDRDSAIQEANRLALKVPTSKFYVCQITDELEAKVNIEVKTWVK